MVTFVSLRRRRVLARWKHSYLVKDSGSGSAKDRNNPGLVFTYFLIVVTHLLTTDASAQSNPIIIENALPGSDEWQLSRPVTDRGMQIKAFASQTTVVAGDRLGFFVSASPPQSYRMQVFRMGFYAGKGGRLVYASPWQYADTQATCPVDSWTGLTRCSWNQNFALQIPENWTTGIYLARFENEDGFDSYVCFALKDNRRTADFYYQQPVTTYQAYNAFPDDRINGKNAYDSFSWGGPTIAGSPRAVRLSSRRPMENTGAERFFMHEHDLIMFLEERGYDIGYYTNIDTHLAPDRLTESRAFISPGHDEYWTRENFLAVRNARDRGVHLAFFGANTAFWQIRFSDDPGFGQNSIMEIYKNAAIDPEPNQNYKTVTFRALGIPEQTLTGVQYITYGRRESDADFVAINTNHWIYNGTGIEDGDSIRGIVGIEIDQVFDALPGPTSTEFTVIGSSPFQGAESTDPSISESVVYRSPSGAWVFASGTLLWGQGLNRPGLRSESLRTMTRNLLDRYAGIDNQPPARISVLPISVQESAGEANVEIKLSRVSSVPVQFSLATRSNSAKQGEDFWGLFASRTIAVGDTSTILPITIIDDDQVEETENFFVRIFAVEGADVQNAEATVSIQDSNPNSPPALSIASAVATESVQFAELTVTLDRPSTNPVQVEYATQPITAERGIDYYGEYGVLSFESGEVEKTIDIQVLEDNIDEPEESINVRLFRPVGASIARQTATLTIKDRE